MIHAVTKTLQKFESVIRHFQEMKVYNPKRGYGSGRSGSDTAKTNRGALKRRPGDRAGIVSTMRFPDFGADVVRSFVRYHASVGFEWMCLFFDDPSDCGADAALEAARDFSDVVVTVIKHDAALRSRWVHCPSYAKMQPFLETEVQARQHLNCEVAMDMALAFGARDKDVESFEENSDRDRGSSHYSETSATTNLCYSSNISSMVPTKCARIDWILHIDSDELFYISTGSVRDHFADLYRDNVWQMTYLNHEGVPEEMGDSDKCSYNNSGSREKASALLNENDYFAKITLFRRHHLEVPMSRAARDGMQYWESRTRHGQYMLCYDNGKSAVRVVKGARPRSVHSWMLPDPKNMPSKTALVDPRALDLSRIRRCSDPCILHYVVCGLQWLKAKYEMLGAFEDAWFGGMLPIAPSFHLDARDAFMATTGSSSANANIAVNKKSGDLSSGNDGRIEALWREQVVFTDLAVREAQLRAGVLLHFERPQRILLGKEEEEKASADVEELDLQKQDQTESTNKNRETALPDRKRDVSTLATAAALRPSGDMSQTPAPTPAAPASTPDQQFTYDKAWMLSNAVQNFL